MPTQKDFKRLVRGRMQKTGESYTAARAKLLEKRKPADKPTSVDKRIPVAKTRSAPAGADYAKLAGMSDDTIKAKTGCTWEKWVGALDYVEAHTWPHREIAAYVHEKHSIPGWWAQAVAVGYERIRGLRAIGQRRDGEFEATKSRTFPVSVSALFDAFASARARAKWLRGVEHTVRKTARDKSVRITWADGTSVEVWLTAKSPTKSSAAVQHRKLPDQAAVTRMKAYWSERLDALGELLAK